jgi:hypothetical protein
VRQATANAMPHQGQRPCIKTVEDIHERWSVPLISSISASPGDNALVRRATN